LMRHGTGSHGVRFARKHVLTDKCFQLGWAAALIGERIAEIQNGVDIEIVPVSALCGDDPDVVRIQSCDLVDIAADAQAEELVREVLDRLSLRDLSPLELAEEISDAAEDFWVLATTAESDEDFDALSAYCLAAERLEAEVDDLRDLAARNWDPYDED